MFILITLFASLSSSGIQETYATTQKEIITIKPNIELEKILKEAWDNKESEIDISELNIPEDNFIELYGLIIISNPEYFYVNLQVLYSVNEKNNTVTQIYIEYNLINEEEILKINNKVKNKIKEIHNEINQENISKNEVLLKLHNYLIKKATYRHTDYLSFTPYGALINNEAVCQGYASAYYLLLKEFNIDCEFVASRKMNHIWNRIKIGKNYYHIDVTWDDLNSENNKDLYEYFLIKENFMRFKGYHDWNPYKPTVNKYGLSFEMS